MGKVDTPTNLIDFEQQTDKIRLCIGCKRYFNDLSASSVLCSECDGKKKPSVKQHVIIRQSPPTNTSISTNLVDFEQKTDKIRPCIVCRQYFNDLLSTGLCSDCDYKKNPGVTRQVFIRRAPPINTYSTVYQNSDFITPRSSSPKIRGPLKIRCHQCGNLNVIASMQSGLDYGCSICRALLQIHRY